MSLFSRSLKFFLSSSSCFFCKELSWALSVFNYDKIYFLLNLILQLSDLLLLLSLWFLDIWQFSLQFGCATLWLRLLFCKIWLQSITKYSDIILHGGIYIFTLCLTFWGFLRFLIRIVSVFITAWVLWIVKRWECRLFSVGGVIWILLVTYAFVRLLGLFCGLDWFHWLWFVGLLCWRWVTGLWVHLWDKWPRYPSTGWFLSCVAGRWAPIGYGRRSRSCSRVGKFDRSGINCTLWSLAVVDTANTW